MSNTFITQSAMQKILLNPYIDHAINMRKKILFNPSKEKGILSHFTNSNMKNTTPTQSK